MNRITNEMLKASLDRLNSTLGLPTEPYTRDDSGFHPNPGVYHLDIAYGGYRVCQMAAKGTGCRDISPRGNKRETYEYIHAMLAGIEATR